MISSIFDTHVYWRSDLSMMKKLGHLNSKGKVYYLRKHDLTPDEIRASSLFRSLNDQEIEAVRAAFKQMCGILLESIENQCIKFELNANISDIAGGKLIELDSFKTKAA